MEDCSLLKEDSYGTALIWEHRKELAAGKVTVPELMNDYSPKAVAIVEKQLKALKPNIEGWEADFGKETMTKGKAYLITAIADACKRSEQQNPGMSEEQKETLLGKVVDKVMSNYKETHGSLKGFNREGKDVTHIDVNDERTAELLEKACKKSHIPMDMKEVTRADGSITHTAFCEVKSIDQVAALLKMASE